MATPATTQRTILAGLGFIESPLLVDALTKRGVWCLEVEAGLRPLSSRHHGR